MKRTICLLFGLAVLAAPVFADKSRFYDGGKVVDTMYVDSEDGLRVRARPSLKSGRLCGLFHRHPVKVVAVGREETVDGITAPWVEILLPRYEWKGDEAEFGWVFGGYLSKERPKFVAPRNGAELREYLCRYPCWQSGDSPSFHFHFGAGGEISAGAHEKGEPTTGSYRIDGENSLVINSVFWGLGETVRRGPDTFRLSSVDEFSFRYEGSFAPYHSGSTFYGSFYYDYEHFNNWKKEKYVYLNFSRSIYEVEYDYQKESFERKLLSDYIKAGLSAEGTEYERRYHDYWEPIMRERQKMADGTE